MGYLDVRDRLAKQRGAAAADDLRAKAGLPPLKPCGWPGCTRRVKPQHYACASHWYSLPVDLRNEFWRHPTEANGAALQDWIKRNHRT